MERFPIRFYLQLGLVPILVSLGCPQAPCPDGFLRDNNGNCVEVGGDDDDDDNQGGDSYRLAFVTTCGTNDVPAVLLIDVFDMDTEDRLVGGGSDGSGEFCTFASTFGGDASLRIEWHHPQEGCLGAVWNINPIDNPEWFIQGDCNGSEELETCMHWGTCSGWDTIDSCWGDHT